MDFIAIVGCGLVTSLGSSVEENWSNLSAGKSGLKELQYFERAKFKAQRAYEISNENGIDRNFRATDILLEAVRQALAQSECPTDEPMPCYVGTGLRELRTLERWWDNPNEQLSPSKLHFGSVLQAELPVLSQVHTISNACSASLFALALASDALASGEAERVVVGGVDVLTASMFGLLDRIQFTAPEEVRPFDKDRVGILMGDGAAAVVIEPLSTAKARGAPILGVLRGVGTSCDAFHETAPNSDGIKRALTMALEKSGMALEDIEFIMMHGTGTNLNDKVEASSMSDMFGELERKPKISAIKSMTGHTSGASGLVGLITALKVLATGSLPPTPNIGSPIDEVDGFGISNHSVNVKQSTALVNAFGFGGVNACALISQEIAA